MFSRTRILLGAGAVVCVLAAWEYVRVEAHAKIAPAAKPAIPDTSPGKDAAPAAPRPVRLDSPLTGVIAAVYVAVDTPVTSGQALALIDSPTLRARLDEAKSNLEMERSAEVNAETEAETLQGQLSSAESYKLDVEAEVSAAEAEAENAKSRLDHQDAMYQAGALAREGLDSAEENYDRLQGAVAAAQARLNEVSRLVEDAQRSHQAALGKVEQARADVQRCALAVANAEAVSGQRWILAPMDGRVIAVTAQVGQPVEAGPRGVALFEIEPSRASLPDYSLAPGQNAKSGVELFSSVPSSSQVSKRR